MGFRGRQSNSHDSPLTVWQVVSCLSILSVKWVPYLPRGVVSAKLLVGGTVLQIYQSVASFPPHLALVSFPFAAAGFDSPLLITIELCFSVPLPTFCFSSLWTVSAHLAASKILSKPGMALFHPIASTQNGPEQQSCGAVGGHCPGAKSQLSLCSALRPWTCHLVG